MAERCEVLFPGAAHASITYELIEGEQIYDGKHDALS
jgi:hypothetical protein